MRRLGGRPERAHCAGSPAPGAPAQAVDLTAAGRRARGAADLHLPHLLRPAPRARRERGGRAPRTKLGQPWVAGRAHGDAHDLPAPQLDHAIAALADYSAEFDASSFALFERNEDGYWWRLHDQYER